MPREVYGDDYTFLPEQERLTDEETGRLVNHFARLGVKKIRLTGGEPLIRSNVDGLVRRIAAVRGIEDIALTTNGLLLHRYAERLWVAGLRRLNVSL